MIDRHQGRFNAGRRTHKLTYRKVLDKATEHWFPNEGKVFQVLSKRNRPISRARDVTTTPAPSKGPHLLGPAYSPAAVRAGTVGKLSETNDLLFLSWSLVCMSKQVYSHSSRIYSRCMVGTVTTGNVPCFKKEN
jgi:hypothetical protein